jgi:hypothetical protein
MPKNFCGDVEVVVKTRYRIDADFEELDSQGRPSNEAVLTVLKDGDYNDILDEEVLETVSVEKVGEPLAVDGDEDPEEDEESEDSGDTDEEEE